MSRKEREEGWRETRETQKGKRSVLLTARGRILIRPVVVPQDKGVICGMAGSRGMTLPSLWAMGCSLLLRGGSCSCWGSNTELQHTQALPAPGPPRA